MQFSYYGKNGIYAESGMGCTGPIVLVPEDRVSECQQILVQSWLQLEKATSARQITLVKSKNFVKIK